MKKAFLMAILSCGLVACGPSASSSREVCVVLLESLEADSAPKTVDAVDTHKADQDRVLALVSEKLPDDAKVRMEFESFRKSFLSETSSMRFNLDPVFTNAEQQAAYVLKSFERRNEALQKMLAVLK